MSRGAIAPEAATAPTAGTHPAALTAPTPPAVRRVRVRVEGTVQGVGFRPYIFRLARELTLGGWVLNDAQGVLLEAEGAPGCLAALLARLPREGPPLASVASVNVEELPPAGAGAFEIRDSSE